MSNNITLSIPASSGVQNFSISKKAIILSFAAITGALAATGGYIYHSWQKQLNAAQQFAQLTAQFESKQQELLLAEQKNLELKEQYDVQVNETHSLSQQLAEKNDQISMLGKRVFDVESVLGLADEELSDELNLEDRIDAAAVDSAVRATMFRMIPNDSPMNYLRISSSYGRRTNPITGKRHTHTGIDLTCKRGEEIYAPADGVVETVRPSKKGFGNFLTVRHSFGFMSSYAHLQKFKVKSGQFVSKGDLIATCGNSGNSTGPHLHYEVRFLGRALNPQYTIDWTPENFNYLFEKEKKVKWAPLVKLIDDTVRLQVNLTNNPYVDNSVDTVKTEELDSIKVQ